MWSDLFRPTTSKTMATSLSLVWRQPAQALLRARTSHGCVLSAQCFASTSTTSTTSGDDTTPALTPLQRARLSLQAAAGALADPSRADLVAALGETTGDFALRAMARRLNNSVPRDRRVGVRLRTYDFSKISMTAWLRERLAFRAKRLLRL